MLSEGEIATIHGELKWLDKRRPSGLSRQREAQYDWLQAQLELDALERQAEKTKAVLTEVRQCHAAMRARVGELKAVIAERLTVPPGELAGAVGDVATLAGELAGVELVERELRKRAREEDATNRELAGMIKQEMAKVGRLRGQTGMLGSADQLPSRWVDPSER